MSDLITPEAPQTTPTGVIPESLPTAPQPLETIKDPEVHAEPLQITQQMDALTEPAAQTPEEITRFTEVASEVTPTHAPSATPDTQLSQATIAESPTALNANISPTDNLNPLSEVTPPHGSTPINYEEIAKEPENIFRRIVNVFARRSAEASPQTPGVNPSPTSGSGEPSGGQGTPPTP